MSPSFLAQRILPFVPMSGAIYNYTTEIPDEFVNQGEPYPRSKCKPIIDLPPEQFDRVLAIYKELPDDLLEHLIRGEEQEDA